MWDCEAKVHPQRPHRPHRPGTVTAAEQPGKMPLSREFTTRETPATNLAEEDACGPQYLFCVSLKPSFSKKSPSVPRKIITHRKSGQAGLEHQRGEQAAAMEEAGPGEGSGCELRGDCR